MVSTSEACRLLGDITPRHFRRLRAEKGPIPGAVMIKNEWAFPRLEIEKLSHAAVLIVDHEETTPEQGAAAILREAAHAAEAGVKSLKTVLESVVEIVKPLAAQIAEARAQSNDSQKLALEAVTMVKDLVLEGGKLEAEQLVKAADQSVRIKRTEVAAKGLHLLMPLAKAGAAKFLGMGALAREGEAEGVLELVRSLNADKSRLAGLMQILTPEQFEHVSQLLAYAEGREKLESSLRSFKQSVSGEQMQALAGMLNQREMMIVSSLFEDLDDGAPAPQQAKVG